MCHAPTLGNASGVIVLSPAHSIHLPGIMGDIKSNGDILSQVDSATLGSIILQTTRNTATDTGALNSPRLVGMRAVAGVKKRLKQWV